MSLTYGSTINDSSTIYGIAKNAIENGRGKAVKFNDEGTLEICTSGSDLCAGLIIYQGEKNIEAGQEVSVQIKDIGLGVAGGAIKVGEYVEADAQGRLVKATSGFVIGMATTPATKENETIYVQITKSGSVPAGA